MDVYGVLVVELLFSVFGASCVILWYKYKLRLYIFIVGILIVIQGCCVISTETNINNTFNTKIQEYVATGSKDNSYTVTQLQNNKEHIVYKDKYNIVHSVIIVKGGVA